MRRFPAVCIAVLLGGSAALTWAEAPVAAPGTPAVAVAPSGSLDPVPGDAPVSVPDEGSPTQALPVEDQSPAPEVHTLPWVDHPRINAAVAYYLGPGRDWLAAALARAKPYRDFIRTRLEEEGMPAELFWLVAIESGFNPAATSRAGAAGLWQFMRNSVGGYGMHVNAYVDERRDWWKSTDGALQKLKDNYGVLGDWYLALAAYNAGRGKIQGILKRAHGERDYWKLLDKGVLPRETAGYVPQLLALARISSRWISSDLPVDWDPSPCWDRVNVDRMVDLRLLAKAAGVSEDELRDANRELIYHLTPVLPGGYNLKVPVDWVDPLRKALDDPSLKLIQYYLYSVQKGDTLSEIAQWYGVSTAMIERDNPGLSPSRLKIGQNLVIAALKDVGPFRKGASRG